MRVIRNVICGVGYGLAFAALFMAWGVIARIIGGADAFAPKGTSFLTVLALSLFGGVAASSPWCSAVAERCQAGATLWRRSSPSCIRTMSAWWVRPVTTLCRFPATLPPAPL